MKKLLVGAIMMLLGSYGLTMAQSQKSTNLGDITLRFCNDTGAVAGTKTAVLEVKPEEKQDICMFIENGGANDATIGLNFVDGTITADIDQKKACEPESTKINFGQYIGNYPTIIQIKAGETVKIGATAKFPAGYAGTAYGCATFQIVNASGSYQGGEETKMFSIISRRANFIDINVLGKYRVDLQLKDAATEGSFPGFSSSDISVVDSLLTSWHNVPEVIAQKNPLALRLGKILITRSVVVNSGNVGLDLSISSHYRAWGGLIDIDQGSQIQKLVPRQRKVVEFATNDIAWWIGGPVTVTQTITYRPIIIGSGSNVDPQLLKPRTITLSTTGFVTAQNGRIIISTVVLILIIGYSIYVIKRNRHKHNKMTRKSFT